MHAMQQCLAEMRAMLKNTAQKACEGSALSMTADRFTQWKGKHATPQQGKRQYARWSESKGQHSFCTSWTRMISIATEACMSTTETSQDTDRVSVQKILKSTPPTTSDVTSAHVLPSSTLHAGRVNTYKRHLQTPKYYASTFCCPLLVIDRELGHNK